MSLDLGTLVAHLSLDASAVTSGAAQANSALQGVQQQGEQTATSTNRSGAKIKAALAIGAIGAFGKASVDAFAEAEQAQLKLQSAFDKFPALADSNIESITKIAEARALTTKFDDDATKAAAAQLAQFNLTGTEIERILPLVQDYAARTGKDLPAAATSLGKAFQGQTRSLKEVGVNYKSTGDEATDFKNIVGLLDEKVGGFAEKQGTTTAGKMDILANKFGELQESVGEAVLPIAGILFDALGGLLKIAEPVIGVISDVISGFGALPGPVQTVVLALGGFIALKMTGALTSISDALTGLPAKLKAMAATARLAGLTMKTALIGTGIGIAIVAISTALSIFSSRNEEAEARVAAHKEAVDRLAGSLDETTGKLTAASAGLITEDFAKVRDQFDQVGLSAGDVAKAAINFEKDGGAALQGYREQVALTAAESGRLASVSDDAKTTIFGLADATGQSGEQIAAALLAGGQPAEDLKTKLMELYAIDSATATEMVNAVRGEFEKTVPALAAVRTKQDELTDATKIGADAAATAAEVTAAGVEATDAATEAADRHRTAVQEAAGAVRTEAENAEQDAEIKERGADAQEAWNEKVAAAEEAASNAEAALTPFAQASQDSADAQSELADQTGRVTDALDRQNGVLPSVEQANADAAESTDRLADSFKVGQEGAIVLGAGILEATGKIKTGTDAGRDFRTQTLGVREAMVAQATAAYSTAVANDDLAGASKAASSAAQGTYDSFITTATAILGSKSAAEKAAAAYGLVPSEVTTAVKADAAQALQQIAAADAAADAAARTRTIPITGDISGLLNQISIANQRLQSAGQTVANIRGVQVARWMGGMAGYASGGQPFDGVVPGTPPSDPRKDNLLAVLETGRPIAVRSREYIVNEGATARNLAALKYINAGGNIRGFAAGTPSAGALAGFSVRSLGDREGNIAGALGDLADVLRDLRDAAADTAAELRESKKSYQQERAERDQTAAAGRRDASEARSEAKRDRLKQENENARRVVAGRGGIAEAEKDGSRSVSAARRSGDQDIAEAKRDGNKAVSNARKSGDKDIAEARRKDTKTAKDRAERASAVAAAERSRTAEVVKAQRERAAAVAAAERARSNDVVKAQKERNAKVAAAERDLAKVRIVNERELRKAIHEGAAAVRRATAEQSKANRQSREKVTLANREYQADLRASKAAAARASEAEDDFRRTTRSRAVLVQLGRQADAVAKNLESARDKLAGLKSDQSQLRGSLRNGIAGFGDGILGSPDQRGNAADVIRGLKFDNAKIGGFSDDLATLKRKGLSASLLEQIAASGVDGGAGRADALSRATVSELAEINRLSKQSIVLADKGAAAVADARFGKEIIRVGDVVARLADVLGDNKVLSKTIAASVADEFDKRVAKLGPNEVLALVRKGEAQAKRR